MSTATAEKNNGTGMTEEMAKKVANSIQEKNGKKNANKETTKPGEVVQGSMIQEETPAEKLARILAECDEAVNRLALIKTENETTSNPSARVSISNNVSKLRKVLLELPQDNVEVQRLVRRFNAEFPVAPAKVKEAVNFTLGPKFKIEDFMATFKPTLDWQLAMLEKDFVLPENIVANAMAAIKNIDGPKAMKVHYIPAKKDVTYGRASWLDTKSEIETELNAWSKDNKMIGHLIIEHVRTIFPNDVEAALVKKYPCFVKNGKPLSGVEIRTIIMGSWKESVDIDKKPDLYSATNMEEEYEEPTEGEPTKVEEKKEETKEVEV